MTGRIVAMAGAAATSAAAGGLAERRAGGGEPGIRAGLRASARVAFLPYAAAFSASSLHALRPSPLSRWLLRHRRQLGLSYASAHSVHVLLLRRLYRSSRNDPPVPRVVAALGSVGLALSAAMAATSWDGAVRRLGPARWHLLHTVGGHFLLATFSYDFLLHAPFKRRRPAWVFGPLTIAVWALRGRAGRLGR